MNEGGCVTDCSQGSGLDVEAETGGKADGAEQTQVVFGEAFRGIADGADQLAFKVVAAAGKVNDLTGPRVFQQGVDGEVAAADIFADVGLEADFRRAAAVEIAGLGAVCG